jgi:flagellar hook assembly protein FlgD
LAGPLKITIMIFDCRGRKIITLFEGERPAGSQSVVWDGREEDGSAAASGVYIVQMRIGGANPKLIQYKKIILEK